jgi:hypothetical protein
MASRFDKRRSPRRTAILVLVGCTLLGIGAGVFMGRVSGQTATMVDLNGLVATERELPLFHTIALSRLDASTHPLSVMVRAGDAQNVAIVSQYGSHDAVQTRVVNGVLHIVLQRASSANGPLRINIASPRLRKITMDGVGTVRVSGGLRSAEMHLEASRGGQITARRLGTRQLVVAARRGGRVDVGGHTSILRAQATAGTIHATDLDTEIAQVSSVQQSRIEVRVSQRLDAFARQNGQIFLKGPTDHIVRDLDPSSSLQML